MDNSTLNPSEIPPLTTGTTGTTGTTASIPVNMTTGFVLTTGTTALPSTLTTTGDFCLSFCFFNVHLVNLSSLGHVEPSNSVKQSTADNSSLILVIGIVMLALGAVLTCAAMAAFVFVFGRYRKMKANQPTTALSLSDYLPIHV